MARKRNAARPRFKRCPKCGGRSGVPIFYGYPDPDSMDPLMEAAREGIVAIGGCCISCNDPEWHCKACGWEWGRARR